VSTALLTDHYELTMLAAALRDGTAQRPCVFEVFARHLPAGRRYAVVAGTARLLDAIEAFRFGEEEIGELRAKEVVDSDTLEWLAAHRFSGSIEGYAEGELYFPGSPILTVRGSFAETVRSRRWCCQCSITTAPSLRPPPAWSVPPETDPPSRWAPGEPMR